MSKVWFPRISWLYFFFFVEHLMKPVFPHCCCCSVAKSCPTLWFHRLQQARLPRVCSNSWPLSWWCHPTISPSVSLFSSSHQSYPASGSFPMSRLLPSGSQSIGTLASVLPMNIHGWFPLGLIGLISLQLKRLSRVFSSTTVWTHHFFGAQPSLWSNSHIHTWPLEKP